MTYSDGHDTLYNCFYCFMHIYFLLIQFTSIISITPCDRKFAEKYLKNFVMRLLKEMVFLEVQQLTQKVVKTLTIQVYFNRDSC